MVARSFSTFAQFAVAQIVVAGVALATTVAHAQPFSRMDGYGAGGANTPIVVIPDDPRTGSRPTVVPGDYARVPGDYSRPNPPQSYAAQPYAVQPHSAPPYSVQSNAAPSPRYASRPSEGRYDGRYDLGASGEQGSRSAANPFRQYDTSNDREDRALSRPVYRRPNSQYRLAARNEPDAPMSVMRDGGERPMSKGTEGDMLPNPPAVPRNPPQRAPQHAEEIPLGQHAMGQPMMEQPGDNYIDAPGGEYESYGGDDCFYDECDDNDCDYDPFLMIRLMIRWSRNLTVDGGVEGFKGPLDLGILSNFGFHEGLNWGVPLFPWWGVGGQIGFEAVNTDLQRGSNPLIRHYREQYFFTTGLFHRPGPCGGLQWGVAFDHLNDEYYVKTKLEQFRGEVSWCGAHQHEIGVWTAIHLNREADVNLFPTREVSTLATLEALDQYNFFYRRRFCEGGDFRLWGGFTGQSDGIFGSDFHVPLSNHLAVQSNFNYIMPHVNSTLSNREAWNLGIGIVFYPGGRARCGDRSLYRPVFDVADNGTFIQDMR